MKDIRIIGVDKDKTRKALGSELYHVYFQLSEVPPSDWKRIFHEIWCAPEFGYPVETAAYASGKYLVVKCVLEDVPQFVLPTLKKAIERTKAEYGEYEARTRKEAEKERRRIAQVLDKLTLDD